MLGWRLQFSIDVSTAGPQRYGQVQSYVGTCFPSCVYALVNKRIQGTEEALESFSWTMRIDKRAPASILGSWLGCGWDELLELSNGKPGYMNSLQRAPRSLGRKLSRESKLNLVIHSKYKRMGWEAEKSLILHFIIIVIYFIGSAEKISSLIRPEAYHLASDSDEFYNHL